MSQYGQNIFSNVKYRLSDTQKRLYMAHLVYNVFNMGLLLPFRDFPMFSIFS